MYGDYLHSTFRSFALHQGTVHVPWRPIVLNLQPQIQLRRLVEPFAGCGLRIAANDRARLFQLHFNTYLLSLLEGYQILNRQIVAAYPDTY